MAFALRNDALEQTLLLSEGPAEAFASVAGILDALPDGVVLYDLAGKVMHVNAAAEALSAFHEPPPRDVLSDLWGAESSGASVRSFAARACAGEVFNDEVRLYRAVRGQGRWISVSGRPLCDASGRRVGAVLRMSDVTEGKATERALVANELRFQQLVHHIHEGFWVMSRLDERFAYLSPAVERILACPLEVLHTRPEAWLERVEASDREALRAARRRVLDGGPENVGFDETYRIRRPDGSVRWIRDRGTPVVDAKGDVYRLAGAISDVTELQEAQAALLERTEALTASNQALTEFAHVASHDLQEPLRMVSSYTRILEEDYGSRLDEDGQEYLHLARDGAERMQRLVRDLLTYSKISATPVVQKPVDLFSVFGRVLRDLGALLEETGAEVRIHPPLPLVLGDEGRLERLFTNLVSNAAKFLGDDGRQVVLSGRKEEGAVVVTVSDDGLGIPPQHLERIFRPFDRLHGPETPGSGMGLAIARRIAEGHGGRIEVRSVPGEGSSFEVWLASAAPGV